MNQPPDEDHFTCIGDYNPPEAQRLLAALTSAGIKFETECYDGVASVAAKGSFGTEANIRVYVDPRKANEAEQLRTDLFGDLSP
jgi:phosphomannomutase